MRIRECGAAAVEAVARLDAATYSSLLLACMTDDVAGVAATAARWLARAGLPAAATDQLWNTMISDRREHVTRVCARAARGLPRWSRSLIALRLVETNDQRLAEIGIHTVDDLLLIWNRSYTAPTSAETDELTTLLDSSRIGLSQARYESLVLAMSSYGVASTAAADLKLSRAEPHKAEARGLFQRLAGGLLSTFRHPGDNGRR